jgi:hypothetical protein
VALALEDSLSRFDVSVVYVCMCVHVSGFFLCSRGTPLSKPTRSWRFYKYASYPAQPMDKARGEWMLPLASIDPIVVS